jgi:hypothetical protein
MLIVAHLEGQARTSGRAKRDRQCGAGGITGHVLGWIADGDQCLLEDAAVGVVDGEARLIDPLAQLIAHAALAGQLLEQGAVAGDQAEDTFDTLQPHPTVSAYQFLEIGREIGRDGELREFLERLHHRIGRHPSGGRVPE